MVQEVTGGVRTFRDLVLNPNAATIPNQGADLGAMAIKGLNTFNDIIENGDKLANTLFSLMGKINQLRGNPEFQQDMTNRQAKLEKRIVQEQPQTTNPVPNNGDVIETPKKIGSIPKKEISPDEVFKNYRGSIEMVKGLNGDIKLSEFLVFIDKNKEDIKKTISGGLKKVNGNDNTGK